MQTDAEFFTVEVVVGVLQPQSFLTGALSTEKQVIVYISSVKSKLSSVCSDCRLAKEIKQLIWNDLEGRTRAQKCQTSSICRPY